MESLRKKIVYFCMFSPFLLVFAGIVVMIVSIFNPHNYDKIDGNTDFKEQKIEYIETIRYATEQEQIEHDREEIEMIAKTVWGEYRGSDKDQKAAVVWCVLNRVDDERFPNNITDVVTQPNQFSGYKSSNPVEPEIVELVEDVMSRWTIEKTAIGLVGRVLPKEYCWFKGDGKENKFRDAYEGHCNIWNWTLESPYKAG